MDQAQYDKIVEGHRRRYDKTKPLHQNIYTIEVRLETPTPLTQQQEDNIARHVGWVARSTATAVRALGQMGGKAQAVAYCHNMFRGHTVIFRDEPAKPFATSWFAQATG